MILGPQIEFQLLQRKPEIYRIFRPVDEIGIRALVKRYCEKRRLWSRYSSKRQSISDLRQLHNMSVLFPDELVRTEVKLHEALLVDLRAKLKEERMAIDKLRQSAAEGWKKANPVAPPTSFLPASSRTPSSRIGISPSKLGKRKSNGGVEEARTKADGDGGEPDRKT